LAVNRRRFAFSAAPLEQQHGSARTLTLLPKRRRFGSGIDDEIQYLFDSHTGGAKTQTDN
jgi:hypothetical protein